MTEDGWYKTGDVATRDSEGYYYIVDRVKELIKYKVFHVHLIVTLVYIETLFKGYQGELVFMTFQSLINRQFLSSSS